LGSPRRQSVGNPAAIKKDKAAGKRRKLSYREQRELGSLPGQIEALEQQQSQLEEEMSAPGFYQSDYEEVQRVTRELAQIQAQLERAFERWNALEGKLCL